MHTDLIDYLGFVATRNGISVQYIEGKKSDPDVAFVLNNVINMNPNYDSKFSVDFRLAHEISHILWSKPTFLYAFSPYMKNREERDAHFNAVKLIAKYIYQEVPLEYRNYINFMDEFGLPSHFEYMVKEAIESI